MGRLILVNFAGAPDPALDAVLRRSQLEMIASASAGGIEHIFAWTRKGLLATEFYQEHKQILDRDKGAGYWLWKPFIILEALRRSEPTTRLCTGMLGGRRRTGSPSRWSRWFPGAASTTASCRAY